MKKELDDKLHELKLLRHSLNAKDKLFASIVKERDLLKEDILTMKQSSSCRFVARQSEKKAEEGQHEKEDEKNLPVASITITRSIGLQCDQVEFPLKSKFFCEDNSDDEVESNPWNVRPLLIF